MNEIERKFFEAFEIEQKKNCYYWDCPHSTGNIVDDLSYCETCKNPISTSYPEITDRILLELMCLIISKKCCDLEYSFGIDYKDYNTLKYCIIVTAIYIKNEIKQEVQALFKEVE